ncbi:TetR/AcrR family transcriptional regulator [Amnibacterium endophyticum]|uniref:TetR/AcrR family transcriptional regulator n=1 Tax=Amnibacterium endophyticum TaxID=2109337 RepID=A0ABW4LGB4_9MICO
MAGSATAARDRLMSAALDLFEEHGYASTTAAQIADRAGVSRATLFRSAPDKREILLLDQQRLHELLREGAASVGDGATPWTVVDGALARAAELFPESSREVARRRRAVVASSVELQERTQAKYSGLAMTLLDALVARGVSAAVAEQAAEAGVQAFRRAHARWAEVAEPSTFPELASDSLATIRRAMAELVTPSR